MSKKEVMAVINMNYSANKIMLPIEEAHKIQAILARHGVRYDTIWRQPTSIHYVQDLEVPEVSVIPNRIVWNACGLDTNVVREWASAISNVDDGEQVTVIDPQVFAQLKGE